MEQQGNHPDRLSSETKRPIHPLPASHIVILINRCLQNRIDCNSEHRLYKFRRKQSLSSLTFAVTCPTPSPPEHSEPYQQYDQNDADDSTDDDNGQQPRRLSVTGSTWRMGSERRRHDTTLRRYFTDLLDVEAIGGAIQRHSVAIQ